MAGVRMKEPIRKRESDCEDDDDEECRSISSSATHAISTTLETITTKTLIASSTTISNIIISTTTTHTVEVSSTQSLLSSTDVTSSHDTSLSQSITSASQNNAIGTALPSAAQSFTTLTTTPMITSSQQDETSSATGTILNQSPTPIGTFSTLPTTQGQAKLNITAIVLIVLGAVAVVATISFLLFIWLRKRRSNHIKISDIKIIKNTSNSPDSPSRNIVSLGREIPTATDDYSEKRSVELSVTADEVSTMDTNDSENILRESAKDEKTVPNSGSTENPFSDPAVLLSNSGSKHDKASSEDDPSKRAIQKTPVVVRLSERLRQTDLYLSSERDGLDNERDIDLAGKMVFDIVRKGKDGEIEKAGRREVI